MRCTGSPLEKPRLFPIYIGTVERDRLFQEAKSIASAQGETTTALVVRALSHEVSRCASQMSVADRIAAADLAEAELLAMLTEEERKEYGL